MKNRLSRLGLLVILSALTVAWSTPLPWGSQGLDSCVPQNVSAALHDAVDSSVRDFAAGLAGAGISAGFIIGTEDEYEREPRDRWYWVIADDQRAPVPFADVLVHFLRRYSQYEAVIRRGQLLVSPRVDGHPVQLRYAVDRFEIVDLFPMAALASVERLIDPRVHIPPVQFVTPGAWPADTPMPPPPDNVSVRLEGVVVLDVLQEVTCRIPGTVWLALADSSEPAGVRLTFDQPY